VCLFLPLNVCSLFIAADLTRSQTAGAAGMAVPSFYQGLPGWRWKRAAILASTAFVLLLLFTFEYRTRIASIPVSSPIASHDTSTPGYFDPELVSFWASFARVLEDVRPHAAKIVPLIRGNPPVEETTYEPDKDKPRVEHLKLSSSDLQWMKVSHQDAVSRSLELASKLPYVLGTKGIVTTLGPRYQLIFVTSLRMLRRSGSKLPVEVLIASWDEYNKTICEEIFPPLEARCRVFGDILKSTNTPELKSFQFKALAILFSSFEHTMFLDSDNFPAINPDSVLSSEPYHSKGLVLWPDLWAETTSPTWFNIASVSNIPVSTRRSSESGQILLSKSLHAATLLLIVYYNYYGPDYYYQLLSQNSHGMGDKETFIHAAMALHVDFYDVKQPLWALGHTKNNDFSLVGMAQYHPFDDWQVTARSPSEPESARSLKPRVLFIHHNFHKLDPSWIMGKGGPTEDADGKPQRMWGTLDGMVSMFGLDLEKILWEELINTACSVGHENCESIEKHYKAVFEL